MRSSLDPRWLRAAMPFAALAACVYSLACLAAATGAVERLAFALFAAAFGVEAITMSVLHPTLRAPAVVREAVDTRNR